VNDCIFQEQEVTSAAGQALGLKPQELTACSQAICCLKPCAAPASPLASQAPGCSRRAITTVGASAAATASCCSLLQKLGGCLLIRDKCGRHN